jgi:hypothetical protein
LISPICWKFATYCGSTSIIPIQVSLHKSLYPFQCDFEFSQNPRSTSINELEIMGWTILTLSGCPPSLIFKSKSHRSWIRSGLKNKGPLYWSIGVNWVCFVTQFIYFSFNLSSKVNLSYTKPLLSFSKRPIPFLDSLHKCKRSTNYWKIDTSLDILWYLNHIQNS